LAVLNSCSSMYNVWHTTQLELIIYYNYIAQPVARSER
jgi:hypothetical protein